MLPIFFGNSAAVFFCGMPTTAVGPVAEEITPTFICACAANETAGTSGTAAAVVSSSEVAPVEVESGERDGGDRRAFQSVRLPTLVPPQT